MYCNVGGTRSLMMQNFEMRLILSLCQRKVTVTRRIVFIILRENNTGCFQTRWKPLRPEDVELVYRWTIIESLRLSQKRHGLETDKWNGLVRCNQILLPRDLSVWRQMKMMLRSDQPPHALCHSTPFLKEPPSFQSNRFHPKCWKRWENPLKTGSNCVIMNSSKGDSSVDEDIFL